MLKFNFVSFLKWLKLMNIIRGYLLPCNLCREISISYNFYEHELNKVKIWVKNGFCQYKSSRLVAQWNYQTLLQKIYAKYATRYTPVGGEHSFKRGSQAHWRICELELQLHKICKACKIEILCLHSLNRCILNETLHKVFKMYYFIFVKNISSIT